MSENNVRNIITNKTATMLYNEGIGKLKFEFI